MKRLLVLCIVLLFASHAFAAEKTRIGFVNLQRALNESKIGMKTKNELEEVIRQKQSVIDEKIKQREEMREELERQSAMLSEEAKEKRVDELQKLEREIERLISDSNVDLQKLQREKEVVILKDLDDIITQLGKEGGFTVILPADVILYSTEGIDITEQVIKKYDASKDEGNGKE